MKKVKFTIISEKYVEAETYLYVKNGRICQVVVDKSTPSVVKDELFKLTTQSFLNVINSQNIDFNYRNESKTHKLYRKMNSFAVNKIVPLFLKWYFSNSNNFYYPFFNQATKKQVVEKLYLYLGNKTLADFPKYFISSCVIHHDDKDEITCGIFIDCLWHLDEEDIWKHGGCSCNYEQSVACDCYPRSPFIDEYDCVTRYTTTQRLGLRDKKPYTKMISYIGQNHLFEPHQVKLNLESLFETAFYDAYNKQSI